MFGDGAADLGEVGAAHKGEVPGHEIAEKEVELTVEVDGAGGFDGEGLDFAIGEGEVGFGFAGEGEAAQKDDAFVRKGDTVVGVLEGGEDAFATDQQGVDRGGEERLAHGF